MEIVVDKYSGLSTWKKVPIILFGGISLRVFLGWVRRKVLRRPPQPFTAPMLGNFYLLPQPGDPPPGTHQVMKKLSDKYGPVMGFWFGSQYTIVLSQWEVIHEALKTKGTAFSGRFCAPALNIITHGRGIALQNDLDQWRKARGCLLNGMTKKIGNDKENKTILIIGEEVQATGKDIVDKCQENGGSVTMKFRSIVGRESLNVFMRTMCSIRYSNKLTPVYEEVRACLENIFQRISAGNPADYMPLLRLAGKPKILFEMEEWSDKMYKHIRGYLNEHKASLDKENPRDFTDLMIINQKEHDLTDQDVEVIMWDVMAGGIDTSATTLEWFFYIVCDYPETQRKIQEELDRVVGPNRLPTWEDKDNLPYLNAAILELMRWKHFAPFGLPHMTLENTTCGGYNIPAGAQVLVNFHASNMDPNAWKKPEEWRPERFLEEEKHLSRAFLDGEMKPTKESHKFIPFGAGQRMCVGWGVGRAVLWLKCATHLHCFQLSSPDGKKYNMDESFGVTVMPEEQAVKFTPRPASKLLKSIENNLPAGLLGNL